MRQLETVLLALALTAAAAVTAQACSCVSPPAPAIALDYAAAVFAGRVFQVDDPRKGSPVYSSIDPMVYHFNVEYVWKGSVADTISIHTVRDGASCGYNFKPGQLYIVYARDDKGTLTTGQCSRTNLFEYALTDRYALPPPSAKPGAPAYSPVTREYIIEQLGSSDDPIFYQAVEALNREGGDRDVLVHELTSIIRGERPGNSAKAIVALRRTGEISESTAQEIAWSFVHGDARARAAALRSLRSMLSFEAYYPYLMDGLADTSRSVKIEAMMDLSDIGRADTMSLEKIASLNHPPYPFELFNGKDSERLFNIISAFLADDNFFLRGEAIECIQYFRTRRDVVIPLLEEIRATDPQSPIRFHAEQSLKHLRSR
jgi:hypothetical protein